MTKVILMKKNEVSIPEEAKGKQIAVKESNMISLKDFYQKNYIPAPTQTIEPTLGTEPEQTPIIPDLNEPTTLNNPIMEFSNETPTNNVISEQPALENQSNNDSISAEPVIDTPVISINPLENNIDETTSEEGSTGTPKINLIPENETVEEMDPELKEIKDRLDKVIQDLNNYKKIKILEIEVNENLEKSREVLKDTQAAAKIMSIQQERQRQITEENGNNIIENSSRILEKDIA